MEEPLMFINKQLLCCCSCLKEPRQTVLKIARNTEGRIITLEDFHNIDKCCANIYKAYE